MLSYRIFSARGSNSIFRKVSEIAFHTEWKKPPGDKDKRHIPRSTFYILHVNGLHSLHGLYHENKLYPVTACTLTRHSVQQLASSNHLFFTSNHLRLFSVAISLCLVIYYFIYSLFLLLFSPSLFFFQSNRFYSWAQRFKSFEEIWSSIKPSTMARPSYILCSEGQFF